jgi:rhodanese-related sulfurtransferase
VTTSAGRGDTPAAIDEFLQQARSGLDRVLAVDLAAEVAAGALVVDIRPVDQRQRDGELPGAISVDRNVLEWRLDPTCTYRLSVADDPDRRIILVCNEGYSSSLAAATLQQLGLRNATDLVGGFQEWLTMTSLGAVFLEAAPLPYLDAMLGPESSEIRN